MASHAPESDPNLRRWLEAEQAGSEIEAELALMAAFRRVPRLAPAPGLAGRVLRAVRNEAGLVDWPERHWERVLVGGSLVLTATLLALLSPFVLFAAGAARLADALAFAGRLLALVAAGFDMGLRVWNVLANVGGAIAATLTTPLGASLVVGHVVVAVVSLVVLRRLIGPRQEAV